MVYCCIILEPEMWKLYKIVVPQIMPHWEDIAYISLHYDIPIVDAIGEKHKNDPKKCCQELLKRWLSSNSEVDPKTWKTLLKQLKEVEGLTASVEEIQKKILE